MDSQTPDQSTLGGSLENGNLHQGRLAVNNAAKEVLLLALNSRYTHTSIGLRYLRANLGELRDQSEILEFVIGKHPRDVVEAIVERSPKILGIGVYIWNTDQVFEVVSILKKVAPQIIVVLGGPEISYETEKQELAKLADYVIQGEGDFLFRELCEDILLKNIFPDKQIISPQLPQIDKINLPYDEYTDEDVAHRVIYVEASRGCPYKCEYCLSSLDKSVRSFDVDLFLSEMQKLLYRGVRQFKFLDRTFNLSPTISSKILRFFLDRVDLGLFLHFEMVPDRLPQEIRSLISQFPPGSLQFEIGVQTWNPQVAAHVSRRQDYAKIEDNFKFLRQHTGVHTHADLIVGLPGETLKSFQEGFDALVSLDPDEIQVGILKRLKGTPIIRHDKNFLMVYSDQPPFSLLQNKDMDYQRMQKMNRFAQYWDLYANSGNFKELMFFLKTKGVEHYSGSLFALFYDFSEFLFAHLGQAHAISQNSLRESAKIYLGQRFNLSEEQALNLVQVQRAKPAKALFATPVRQQKHLDRPLQDSAKS